MQLFQLFVLLFISMFIFHQGVDGNNSSDTLKDKTVLLPVSTKVQVAAEALHKIKEVAHQQKRTSVNIGERHHELGFSNLEIVSSSRKSVFKTSRPVQEQLEIFLNSLPLTLEIREAGMKTLKYLDQDEIECHRDQAMTFSFISPKTGGEMDISFFSFKQTQEGKWELETFKLKGSFKVMPDWYIKTTSVSKESFLKSSSSETQEIVYVDRGVTQSDMQNLFLFAMPDITGVIGRNLLTN